VFFFSSRRRHTRCLSDWSSDVCSSDLKVEVIVQFRGGPDFSGFYSSVIRGRMLHEMRFPAILEIEFQIFQNSRLIAFDGEMVMRSEERRVGKECRYRMWK